jgi:hypothetical protein
MAACSVHAVTTDYSIYVHAYSSCGASDFFLPDQMAGTDARFFFPPIRRPISTHLRVFIKTMQLGEQ